jgi:hypothetical protein
VCFQWVDSSSSSTTSLYKCIRFWYSSSFRSLKREKKKTRPRGCSGVLGDRERERNKQTHIKAACCL